MIAVDSIQKEFEKGQYQKAIALVESIESGTLKLGASALAYYIGALAFAGRVVDAESLYRQQGKSLSAGLEMRVRFFLIVSYCRQSRYLEATELLIANLQQRRLRKKRRALESIDEFFVRQGLAFFRYNQASYAKSRRQVHLAREAAQHAKSDYGLILAQDLRGHLHAQFQEHEAALRDLRQSSQRARSLGLHSLCTASEISQLIYQAEQGLDREVVLALQNAIETFPSDDTYSKSNLRLELARQLFWRGQIDESLRVLDLASRTIHETRNRRQEARLNLRYADAHLFAGRNDRALSHLRFAELCLLPSNSGTAAKRFDLDLALELAATERRALLARQQDSHAIERKILDLRAKTGLPEDFDPQTRLQTSLSADPDDQNRLARDRGLLSFLVIPEAPDRARRYIVLDLFPGSILTAHQGEVRLRKGLAPLLRKTLLAIAREPKSKQELIETIWGYDYDPIRHDALIYSTFATLRRLLDRRGHWIETLEQGYGLSPEVTLLVDDSSFGRIRRPSAPSVKDGREVKEGPTLASQLNYRQIDILKLLKKKNYVTTSICQELFSVSEITASRDLAHLLRLKLICRLGKGRAIRYTLDVPAALQSRESE